MLPIDKPILIYLFSLTASSAAEPLVIFAARYLGWLLLAGFVFYSLAQISRGYSSHWRQLLFALTNIIAAWVAAEMLQFFILSPRPFALLPEIHQLVPAAGNSFPSGHAAAFFALGLAIFKYQRRLGAVCLSAAAIIGLSRVLAGVHWLSDILAGFLLAALAVGLISFFSRRRYNDRHA